MKIIYDDIIYSLQKVGGISVYWNELENRIPVDMRLLYKDTAKNKFYLQRDNEVILNDSVFFYRYKNVCLKNEFIKKNPFIFHSSYYRFCKNKKAINITTIHDFTYEHYAKGIPLLMHHLQKKNTILNSDGVICISENTLNDLKKFIPEYNGEVVVIGHGYSTEYSYHSAKKRLPNFLYVGNRNGYKNFKFAVEITKKIPNTNLLIVGGGELNESEKLLLEHNLYGRYMVLGYLTNEDLSKLYNESLCLLYTSDYEGFGIPALEAMACGCPVVCQKKSSLQEVCGEAGIYVDPDYNASAVVGNLLNNNFFEEYSHKSLERAKLFSWDITAKKTLEFYEKVYNKKIKYK